MCIKCVKRFKHLKLSSKTKAKTYGQIKALAQSFDKNYNIGVYDKPTNCGVEAG